jgi:hypothetical protein
VIARADCGVWLVNEDITAYDISSAENVLATNGDACKTRCMDTPGCNALVYKKTNQQCWLKSLPVEGMWSEPVVNNSSDSLLLCPNEVLQNADSAGGAAGSAVVTAEDLKQRSDTKGLSAGAVAGIVVSVFLVAMAVCATITLWALAMRKRRRGQKRGSSRKV